MASNAVGYDNLFHIRPPVHLKRKAGRSPVWSRPLPRTFGALFEAMVKYPPVHPPDKGAGCVSERTREERIARVREALMFLPSGVPPSLWGFNAEQLAEAIVDGEKRLAPSGMPLVRIRDKWYYNEPGDLVTFMQEAVT